MMDLNKNKMIEQSERLRFLVDVVKQEIKHLNFSDKRVFTEALTTERAMSLTADEVLAEKIEAFGSRFGRLQDTIGDKLLPLWLSAIGEKTAAFVDNLNKAEKLNTLTSAERWMEIRLLSNKMVHEYIKDYRIFAEALQSAHEHIPFVILFAENIMQDITTRKLC